MTCYTAPQRVTRCSPAAAGREVFSASPLCLSNELLPCTREETDKSVLALVPPTPDPLCLIYNIPRLRVDEVGN